MTTYEILDQDITLAASKAADVSNSASPMLLGAEAAGHEDPITLVQGIVCDPDPELLRQRQQLGDLVIGAAAARIAILTKVEVAFGDR